MLKDATSPRRWAQKTANLPNGQGKWLTNWSSLRRGSPHDCDCMEYTCFCGKVKDLVEAQRVAYGTPSEDSTDESESEWTDCSESELADMMKHACECSDANCGCASGGTQGQNVPKDVFL